MNRIKDQKIKEVLRRRNIEKTNTIKTYYNLEVYVTECFNMTMSEMIEIARKEERPYINEYGNPDFRLMDERQIYNWQFQLLDYLKAKGLKNSSIEHVLSKFRTIFKEFEITLPKPLKLAKKQKIIMEGDIPNKKDIKEAIVNCYNYRDKFAVLLASVTGLRGVDIRNLKIKDIVTGCRFETLEEFMHTNTNHTFCELFLTPQKTEAKGNPCLTFVTPECLEYCKKYLKTRENLTLESPLITTKLEKHMSVDSWLKIFQRIDQRVFNGDGWFHAHSLRAYFINIVNKHTVDDEIRALMSGHTPLGGQISRAYNQLDTDGAKDTYYQMAQDLTLKEVKVSKVIPSELKQANEQIKILTEQNKMLEEKMKKMESMINRLTSFNLDKSDQDFDLF